MRKRVLVAAVASLLMLLVFSAAQAASEPAIEPKIRRIEYDLCASFFYWLKHRKY